MPRTRGVYTCRVREGYIHAVYERGIYSMHVHLQGLQEGGVARQVPDAPQHLPMDIATRSGESPDQGTLMQVHEAPQHLPRPAPRNPAPLIRPPYIARARTRTRTHASTGLHTSSRQRSAPGREPGPDLLVRPADGAGQARGAGGDDAEEALEGGRASQVPLDHAVALREELHHARHPLRLPPASPPHHHHHPFPQTTTTTNRSAPPNT
jgi:hypothetical protein